jgi:cytochrome c
MAAPSQRILRLRKVLFISLLAAIGVCIGIGVYQNREWKVPEEAKRMKNPILLSEAALRTARRIYLDKCAECHGETGKGDGPQAAMYSTPPASFTDAKLMASLTDGEIFYQISEGRKPMPAFKKRLTQEQRWQLVLFVRSFTSSATSSPESTGATVPPTNR